MNQNIKQQLLQIAKPHPHCYGVYEIDKDQYDFVDLPNPKPFLSFRMNSFDCIEKGTEKLVNGGK